MAVEFLRLLDMNNGKQKSIILIYAADHDLAKSLTLLLQDQYRVHSTSILAKATEVVERREVDLLITDFGLSLEEGFKAFERMRLKNPGIPIIVFCPYQSRYSEIEAKIRGQVNECFHKPVNIEEVMQAIAKLLKTQNKSANLIHSHH